VTDDTARSAFGAPPPDPELQRLAPLLGTWTSEDHTRDSVLGPGVPVTSTETFRWLEGGNRYEGKVADRKLTFEGPARFQYELGDDGKVAMNPDGTICVAWWLRDENGEWAPWMDNTFTWTAD
jgi:hypothetical protein